MSRRRFNIAGSGLALALLLVSPGASAQEKPPMLVGDAARGRDSFVQLNCYACHGYQGQTGERRLIPMQWSQAAFITYLRTARPLAIDRGMPGYTSVSAAQLADVYAYLQSLKLDAPDVSSLPALQAIRDRLLQK